MNLFTETPSGELIECSSKLHSEASFVSETTSACPTTWIERPVLSPSNDVQHEDIENENCEDCLSLAASHSSQTLFSLKISWDYFKELGKHPSGKALAANSHSRKSSSGSSNCSELGTTMKEIFGPLKLYECKVPLASSETLSEISSMSSRASFNIMKDRSPLTRLKLAKNLSLRVHENGNAHEIMNGSGKTHQRSLSCVYPEGKKTNHFNPYSTMNGKSNGNNRFEDSETKEDLNIPLIANFGGSIQEFEIKSARNNNEGIEEVQDDDVDCCTYDIEEPHAPSDPSEDPQEAQDEEGIKNTQSEDNTTTTAVKYSPVYPVFSHQQEYGVPIPTSPHYNYSSQSPLGSTPSVHSEENLEGAIENT